MKPHPFDSTGRPIKDETALSDKYQTITLHFSDRTSVTFTGRAFMSENDPVKSVIDITIGPPKDLPAGCKFEDMP